jgi:hypothetical protein
MRDTDEKLGTVNRISNIPASPALGMIFLSMPHAYDSATRAIYELAWAMALESSRPRRWPPPVSVN